MMYPNTYSLIEKTKSSHKKANKIIADNKEKKDKIKNHPVNVQNNQFICSPLYFNQMPQQSPICPTRINKKANINKPHPKTKFTQEEDSKLYELVQKYGESNMYEISKEMDGRNIRQCRERWRNYLSPKIDNGPWTKEEDDLLFQLLPQYGPRWKTISKFFPKRTDINIKSRFNIFFRRYLRQKKKSLKQYLQQQKSGQYNCNYYIPNLYVSNYFPAQIINQTVNNYAISNQNKNKIENPVDSSSLTLDNKFQNKDQENDEDMYTDDIDLLFDDAFDMPMINSNGSDIFKF